MYDKKNKPTQRLRLKGGAVVDANFNMKGICKKCKKEFFWAVTRRKHFMPIVQAEDGEWLSHYADCPFSNVFKTK